MALLKFFKTPRHQQYEYKPRFWDPKKEELEERLKRIEAVKNNDPEAIKKRIAGGFRKGYSPDASQNRRRLTKRSNYILLGVILILLLLTYMFITVYLPRIVQVIEGSGQI
ncbi:MAG: hypothetical protein GY705_14305 [Bacteroidetes bacterium]|nr:hypothetical protein [Bacteroidota bacterium]